MSPKYLLPFFFLGCVEISDPPTPTTSVAVNYGSRIYLADAESDFVCRYAGPVGKDDRNRTTVGGVVVDDPTFRVDDTNCFVNVLPGVLWVDQHEVTNEQFQLCVDSDACNEPNPADANKSNTCESENEFDQCPVIGVPQYEALRYCEWVGRRLPSGIEHIVARQRSKTAGQISTAKDPSQIAAFPTGNDKPNSDCESAVLAGCGTPQAVKADDAHEGGAGAAVGDRSPDGVYDLMGNVSEWASDLIPPIRGEGMDGMPWFCAEPIPAGATTCPEGRVCVYGRRAQGNQVNDAALVCITTPDLVIHSGALGTFVGGNYDASQREAVDSGTFAHHTLDTPGAQDDSTTGINGFRCVSKGAAFTRDNITPAL